MNSTRIARPLPGPMPEHLKHDLARRHLELFIRGLRGGGEPLEGPELSRRDLTAMVSGEGPAAAR